MFLNYLSYLTCRKQCVQSFGVFDFLRDIVRRVPDLGGSEAGGHDKSLVKKRLVDAYIYIHFSLLQKEMLLNFSLISSPFNCFQEKSGW